MKIRLLLPYLAITFGLTWGLVALLILFPNQLAAVFGELSVKNPLFILAVYAPAILAFNRKISKIMTILDKPRSSKQRHITIETWQDVLKLRTVLDKSISKDRKYEV